ncbi:MAG: redox-sensing transcriptional repressor Rex [Spirochaetales bacterium]|nr:redox-sensing transcriptional repressor Rex [Spirochaetales bacterium]
MITNKKSILRLSRYKKALTRLHSMGFKKVFSDNLADAIGVTPSQVRKDFSIFDLSGHKKGGYLIDDLIHKINKILGKEEVEKVIIIGCGNIGTALMQYNGFEKEFIKIVAAFDSNPAKINNHTQIPILPIEEMHNFVIKEKIRTAVLAVPEQAAQDVVDMLVNAGIKGVLNFSPLYLRVPEDFIISNVNLEVELEGVIYFVNAMQNSSEKDILENRNE